MTPSSTTPKAGQQPEPAPAPLSPERLAEYAALAQAATKGPWEADSWEINSPTSWVGETCDVDDDKKSRADAAFIAAARTAVPELLAEVERIETGIQAAIDRDRDQYPEGPDAEARLGLLAALRIVQGDRFGVPAGGAA